MPNVYFVKQKQSGDDAGRWFVGSSYHGVRIVRGQGEGFSSEEDAARACYMMDFEIRDYLMQAAAAVSLNINELVKDNPVDDGGGESEDNE